MTNGQTNHIHLNSKVVRMHGERQDNVVSWWGENDLPPLCHKLEYSPRHPNIFFTLYLVEYLVASYVRLLQPIETDNRVRERQRKKDNPHFQFYSLSSGVHCSRRLSFNPARATRYTAERVVLLRVQPLKISRSRT